MVLWQKADFVTNRWKSISSQLVELIRVNQEAYKRQHHGVARLGAYWLCLSFHLGKINISISKDSAQPPCDYDSVISITYVKFVLHHLFSYFQAESWGRNSPEPKRLIRLNRQWYILQTFRRTLIYTSFYAIFVSCCVLLQLTEAVLLRETTCPWAHHSGLNALDTMGLAWQRLCLQIQPF